MLARTHTFTIDGLAARHVTVEADVRGGLPGLTILGFAGAPREARERVRAAILNSGYRIPARRITVSLAPAGARSAGPGLDLALACAILAASGQLPRDRLDTHALFGELALDGSVRDARGSLAAADAARRRGLAALIAAGAVCTGAALVADFELLAANSLRAAARILGGGAADTVAHGRRPPPTPGSTLDLADVRGQRHAVRALAIAAAGGHNLLLCGAPGTGKTMLAQRLPGLLPPLDREEALELGVIASLGADGASPTRPFRAPHHTVTATALLGGRPGGPLGEVVLAHGGVLFLDELPAFRRDALEALRRPLEEGNVVLSAGPHRRTLPARFQLLAAANPCACGFAAEPGRCACGDGELTRHARRLGGPLLDRIDLVVPLQRDGAAADACAQTTTARAAGEVALARERQRARLRGEAVSLNARMDPAMLRRHALLEEPAAELLRRAQAGGLVSARGRDRTLRVARTIADLDGRRGICERDVGAALSMRPEAALPARPA